MDPIRRFRCSRSVAAITCWFVLLAGCKSKQPATQQAAAPAGAAPAAGAPAAPAAAAQMSVDELVAPVALYPDQLLGQLLVAATNPQEVLDLGNWLIENQSLKSDAAPAAAKKVGFSTSAQYLASFPQVVDNMCQEMDWTTQLGAAFKADQAGVMAAVQRKRTQAQQQGNLQSSPQMTVASQTDNGQQVVVIQPANPQVVYVPQYNPETVYTQPAPAQTTTTVVQEEKSGVSTGGAIAIGLLSFGVGMAVGASMNNNYYPYPSWGYGGMYYGGRPYYPPPYRPPVYPGYHGGGYYRPPANYRWSQYNHNTNVRINNNYYNNRYRNTGGTRAANNGYIGARPGAAGGVNRAANNGYLGARPGGVGDRNGAGMAGANPNRNLGGGGRNTPATRPATNPARGGNLGAGGGGIQHTSDRGFGGGANGRQQNTALAQNRAEHNGGGAFGGGGNNGRAERAASNRGHESMGGGARGGGGGGKFEGAHGGGGGGGKFEGAHGGGGAAAHGGGRHR